MKNRNLFSDWKSNQPIDQADTKGFDSFFEKSAILFSIESVGHSYVSHCQGPGNKYEYAFRLMKLKARQKLCAAAIPPGQGGVFSLFVHISLLVYPTDLIGGRSHGYFWKQILTDFQQRLAFTWKGGRIHWWFTGSCYWLSSHRFSHYFVCPVVCLQTWRVFIAKKHRCASTVIVLTTWVETCREWKRARDPQALATARWAVVAIYFGFSKVNPATKMVELWRIAKLFSNQLVLIRTHNFGTTCWRQSQLPIRVELSSVTLQLDLPFAHATSCKLFSLKNRQL